MKIIKGLLLILNIALIAATLGAFVAPYIPPAKTSIFPVLGLLTFGLLFGNLSFVIFWFWVKPKFAIGSILTILMGIPNIPNLYALNLPQAQSTTLETLHLATYNMQFSKPLIHQNDQTIEEMEERFEDFLKKIDYLDILGVQECGWRTKEHITKSMQFPYHYFIDNIYTGIYSKHPIINKGFVDFGQHINKCLWADIVVNKDTIRFYVAHLEPNRFDGKVPVVLNQETKEKINIGIFIGIAQHQAIFTNKRNEQAELIRAHQAQSPYPSIICGDFNDIPQTYTYQTISKGLKDTFLESGTGIGTTHGGLVPGLRIDYILVDKTFSVINHQVHKIPFSDHYLVEGEVQY